MSDHDPNVAALQSLFDAFNAHDIDLVMKHFGPNAVFDIAAGPHPHGDRLVGVEAIMQAFLGTFKATPDCHWDVLFHEKFDTDRYVSFWIFSGSNEAGVFSEGEGVDLFTFVEGLISHKSVFRKGLT